MEANVSSHKWTLSSQSSPTQPRPCASSRSPSSPTVCPVFSPPLKHFFFDGDLCFPRAKQFKARVARSIKAKFCGQPQLLENLSSLCHANTRRRYFGCLPLILFTILFFWPPPRPLSMTAARPAARLFDCAVRTFLANLPWRALSILIFEHAAGSDIEDLGGK